MVTFMNLRWSIMDPQVLAVVHMMIMIMSLDIGIIFSQVSNTHSMFLIRIIQENITIITIPKCGHTLMDSGFLME